MKSIIQRLVNKKESGAHVHHLKLMRELDGREDLAALQATSKFLTILPDTSHEHHAAQLDALLQLDEFNHPRFEKTILQYVKFDKLRSELEANITDTCYYYQRQIFLNYRMHVAACVKLVQLRRHYDLLPLLISRAITAAYNMIKLRYFRHQLVPDGAWLQIFSMYGIAEKHEIIDELVTPYAGKEPQSVATLLAQACMLESINQSNLNRLQIEVVSQLLQKLLNEVRVTDDYDEKQHSYFVDLQQDKGARRIRSPRPSPDFRYWSTDQLVLKIELLSHAKNQQELLQRIGIGELVGNQAIPALIKQLQSDWSESGYKRQRRKEDRTPVAQTVTVILGAERIFAHAKTLADLSTAPSIKLASGGRSFEERLSSHSMNKGTINSLADTRIRKQGAHWTISDESASGYGALLPREEQQSLTPGTLVGLQFEGQQRMFAVGILRNISELPTGQRHAGIEVLSHNAVWVQAVPTKTVPTEADPQKNSFKENIALDSMGGFSGLYLAPEAGIADTASLLLPRLKFQQNLTYRLSTFNTKLFQRLAAPMDARNDWVRVRFEGTL